MFSKQFVSNLLAQNIDEIDSYATELVKLANTLPTDSPTHAMTDTNMSSSELTDYFKQQMHFTESQGKMLVAILNRYAVLEQPVPFFNQNDDKCNKPDSRTKPNPASKRHTITTTQSLPADASSLLKALQEPLEHHYPSYL